MKVLTHNFCKDTFKWREKQILFVPLFRSFVHLHIGQHPCVNFEAQGRTYEVESLMAGGPGIDDEHIVKLVVHHAQDMGMAADENVGTIHVNYLPGLGIVPAGKTADMRHQDFFPFTLEKLVAGAIIAQVVAVHISVHPDKVLERRQAAVHLRSPAKISGVPYLIHGSQELKNIFVQAPVRIRYDPYGFQNYSFTQRTE